MPITNVLTETNLIEEEEDPGPFINQAYVTIGVGQDREMPDSSDFPWTAKMAVGYEIPFGGEAFPTTDMPWVGLAYVEAGAYTGLARYGNDIGDPEFAVRVGLRIKF